MWFVDRYSFLSAERRTLTVGRDYVHLNLELDHVDRWEAEWRAQGRTVVELPPVDVNEKLSRHYTVKPSVAFTRTMLWDMEVRKALEPDRYIPSVVMPGSVQKWDRDIDGPRERFVRVSEQRLWTDPSRFNLVIEAVYLDHDRQTALFIGLPKLEPGDGRQLHAGTDQPLFYVEHSVDGTERRPLNLWRIVHLTESVDSQMLRVFEQMGTEVWLREFVEVYIRDDLGARLERERLEG